MCSSSSKEKTRQHKSKRPTRIFCSIVKKMLKQLFVVFRYYFDYLIDFCFSLYWDGKKQMLPDLDRRCELLTESATSLAKKIREKKLKSEELVNMLIERIKSVNPIINAVTDERFEAALVEAREIDKKIALGLSDQEFQNKPYLGVPFTTKESNAVSGMLHTLGLASRRHLRAADDAECVRLMRQAGGIPIAVTNVPELNKWQEARNLVFGQTNNPYHTGRTAGGSSGGETALLASYGTVLSICSDIGGSTRMPSFYCGVFGHNPTANVCSVKGCALRTGDDDASTMASTGIAARHVEDLAPLVAVLAGPRAPLLRLDRHVDVAALKIFYAEGNGDLRCSSVRPDLRKAMKSAVSRLGASVRAEGAPRQYRHAALAHSYALWRHHMTREAQDFSAALTNYTGYARALPETFKKLVGAGGYTWAAILKLWDEQILPAVDPDWADKLTADLRSDLLSKLGEDGVLLFPSAPHVAPYHASCFLRPYNFAYWGIFNVLRLPATQVPLGLNAQGLPLGVQVVSAPHNDALCLAVARHLQQEFGGFVPPCRLP